MSIISEDEVWFSPVRAFSAYLKAVEEFGLEAVLHEGKYKRIMETRAIAVLCFALFEADKTPWYLQMCKDDPPDALIMRQSPTAVGDHDILGVEVTSYIRNKRGVTSSSLFEQLKKTKMFEHYHKYSDHDVILVDLGIGYKPDFNEIADYMKKIGAPYQIWSLQEVQSSPDTIVEMTICSIDGAFRRRINIGEVWHRMKEQNIAGAFRAIRVGSIDKVGIKEGGEAVKGPPWETMYYSK